MGFLEEREKGSGLMCSLPPAQHMCSRQLCGLFRPTFFLHLAFYIRVINDFTNSDTAQDWAQGTLLPAQTMGTIEEGEVQVTGQVGAFAKQRGLQKFKRHLAQIASHPRKSSGSTEILPSPKTAEVAPAHASSLPSMPCHRLNY